MNSSGSFKTGCGILIVAGIAFCVVCCAVNSMDFSTFATLLFLIFLVAVAAVIYWIVGTAKAAKETYVYIKENCIELIDAIIDLFTIKREIKRKCPAALRAKILERKQHSVKVGIFDSNYQMTEKVTLTGAREVVDEVQVGEIIPL